MRSTLATPLGELVLDAGERGLIACGPRTPRTQSGDDSRCAARHLDQAREALHEYFGGVRRNFDDLDLALRGTDFQREVWSALRALPYGSAVAYAELARSIGRPRAMRAVGQANARNPIAIIQPCHRVLGADGSLVGFAGGLERKRWLLEHERCVLDPCEDD